MDRIRTRRTLAIKADKVEWVKVAASQDKVANQDKEANMAKVDHKVERTKTLLLLVVLSARLAVLKATRILMKKVEQNHKETEVVLETKAHKVEWEAQAHQRLETSSWY